MKFRCTLPARDDLQAILDYIDRQSPQGPARVQARIQEIIDLLLLHPLSVRARTTRDPPHGDAPYPYLVFYEATDDAARDPSSMPE